jgi:hypothetical protein
LSHLSTRRLTDRGRTVALALACTALIGTALLLAVTRPSSHAPRRPHATAPHRAPAGKPEEFSGAAGRVSRTFLAGYLPYLNGHASARLIHGATAALTRSLAARPPLVSPYEHTVHPRLLAVTAAPGAAGLGAVRVLLSDGGLIHYQLTLLLTTQHGRLLVAAVKGQ